MKRIELIEEKFANFLKFIDEKCPESVKAKFAEHKNVKAETFMLMYVAPWIYPNKDNLDALLNQIIDHCGVKKADVDPAVLEKMKRYFEFFCGEVAA